MSSKKLGQYFTTSEKLQNIVFNFIKNNPKEILEPSVGRGDLVKFVKSGLEPDKSGFDKIKFDCYEIDEKINFIIDKNLITFGDFLEQKIEKRYKTIIGNPPYVKTKKGNLYIDFIDRCFDLLEENGELIFIIPSDFFKLTKAGPILNKMLMHGGFTDIFHPNDETFFKDASIDIIIFRYQKGYKENIVKYNEETKQLINSNGIITFQKSIEKDTKNLEPLEKYFDVFVGLVSGKEEIFKNNLGNIEILNDKDKVEKYILIKQFPTENEDINNYLLENKDDLMERKIRKFTEKNWFEFGAPRNIKTMEQENNKDCIYIKTLTRSKEVAFTGKVQYFGGGLIMLLPKYNNIDLEKLKDFLNTESFKINYVFSNRFKMGHKQICNILLDFGKYKKE